QGGLLAASALALAVTVGGSISSTSGAAPSKTPRKPAPASKAAPKPKAGPPKAAPAKPKAAAPATNLSIPFPAQALGAPAVSLPPDPTFRDASLVVDFSSEWQGYLEPCG
ncbi:MAG: hypothetical protein KY468_20325, partial [Armatimonadetes bacterium]|nr:hypothetical protein [Armatimonadota bacterium]